MSAASSPASPARGRPALKRTKNKGGAELDKLTILTHTEAVALAVEQAVVACGGATNLSQKSLFEIFTAINTAISDQSDLLHPKSMPEKDVNGDPWPDPSLMFSAQAVAELAVNTAMGLRSSLVDDQPAGAGAFHAVVHDDQGTRKYMEDKWVIAPCLGAMFGIQEPQPTYFYGVYDGHTGKLAAEYVRTHLHSNVARQPNFSTDLGAAIEAAYLQTDAEWGAHAKRLGLKDGTTAVTFVVRGDQMYTHWCGDSEATLCHRSRSVRLCDPHTPAREDEKERIQKSGGTVVWFGTWRVNGTLGVARSIGDYEHTECVVAQPDYIVRKITSDDAFVMLATDGLYDVITHDEATKFTVHWVNSPQRDADDICRALVGESLRRKTKDNVTCMFIFFKQNPLPKMRPARLAHPKVPTLPAPVPSQAAIDAAKAAAE